MFQLAAQISAVRLRPAPASPSHLDKSSRLILRMLGEDGTSLTTRDILTRVMEARGLNAADRGMYEAMRHRVSASLRGLRGLRGLRDRRRVASEGKAGAGVKWWIEG